MLFSLVNRRYTLAFSLILVVGAHITLSASVADRVRADLKSEEQRLLGDFCAAFGITASEWESFKKQYEYNNYSDYESRELDDIKKRCSTAVSDLLRQKILAILAQSPIKRAIKVVRDHSPTGSDIVALQNTLVVDEERFTRNYPEDSQIQAIIWHEITHIMHEDDLIMRALAVLRDTALNTSSYSGWLRTWGDKVKDKFNESQYQSSLVPWYHFRERRADLLSGLADKANAAALAQAFKRFSSVATEKHDNLHPTMATRVAYLNKLHSDITQG
jgi:hypothetical protein